MAGLLDSLNSDQGLLGLSLLAAAAPRAGGRTGFGEGLLGAVMAMQQRKTAEEDRRMRQQQMEMQRQQQALQLQQMQRQVQQQDTDANALRGLFQPLPGPTQDGSQLRRGFDPAGMLQAGASPQALQQAMQLDQMVNPRAKPAEFKEVGGHLVRIGGDGQVAPAWSPPAKPQEEPTAVREYLFAKTQQGYRGTFEEWKKSNAKAGASSVVVNAEKPFINALGEGLGKQIDGSLAQAKAAQGTISTAQNIMRALDSGKVISGPGATWRVAGLQLGQVLGVGGKDSAEVLSNTRSVIQSMAQAELDAAMQMRGQGQITEAERDIIRRAASGNIDSLTSGEIRLLAGVMDRSARSKIAAHSRNVNSLRQMPNAAPLLPFYSVDEPPQYGTQTNGVRRYNPTTGRIE